MANAERETVCVNICITVAPDTEGGCAIAKENARLERFFWDTRLPPRGFL